MDPCDYLRFLLAEAGDMHRHEADAAQGDPGVGVGLLVTPLEPKAGELTTLTLSFRRGNAPAQLTPSHERLFHLAIVSGSFDSFSHLHAEDFGLNDEMLRSGDFTIPYVFPHGGAYLVAVDYQDGGTHASQTFLVQVEGRIAKPVQQRSPRETFSGYDVGIQPSALALQYHIARDAKPVTDLQPHLGAAMHVAAVSEDLQTFIHTHGHPPGHAHAGHHDMELPLGFGPAVEVPLDLSKPGIYHVFGEFKHEDKIVTTHFTIEV